MCLITASKVKPVCSASPKTVASKCQESLQQVIRSLIVIKQKKVDYVLKDNWFVKPGYSGKKNWIYPLLKLIFWMMMYNKLITFNMYLKKLNVNFLICISDFIEIS